MGISTGIGLGITQQRRIGVVRVITAIVDPAISEMQDGDTIESALSANIDQTSNYASTEGTIIAVDVVATVNGDPALTTDTVSAGDVVLVAVTVTDSAANDRVFRVQAVAA